MLVRRTTTLAELLTHLYVLIPVFDNRKHYWVGDDEMEKLLANSEGWLAAFTPDGTFTDESIGVTYRGRDRAFPLENFGRPSPTCTASCTSSTSTATWSSSSSRCNPRSDHHASADSRWANSRTGLRLSRWS